MRLIDAKGLEKQVKQVLNDNNPYLMVQMLRWIRNQQKVDAVEVVRCKECKHWRRNVGFVDSPNGHCFCHDIDPNQFDFCSYGERREGE